MVKVSGGCLLLSLEKSLELRVYAIKSNSAYSDVGLEHITNLVNSFDRRASICIMIDTRKL